MIGPKKLSEIKRELRQALGNDQALAAWLDQQVSRSTSEAARGSSVEEDLLWVRDLLREAVVGTKPRARGAKTSKTKRTSAVR